MNTLTKVILISLIFFTIQGVAFSRYYDPQRGQWISVDSALIQGKYFPKANDFDTEHDYFWYQQQDASKKLPGIGGVFNSVNLNPYCYAGNNPVKFVDPDGNTFISNTKFFFSWVFGLGGINRNYGPETIETQEMRNSLGADELRKAFYVNGCVNRESIRYDTYKAYYDTVANPETRNLSDTSAQVGGFAGASAINNGDNTVTFTIPNKAGTKSFFYHALPDRKGTSGPMRNINQTFTWTEEIEQPFRDPLVDMNKELQEVSKLWGLGKK